jgi:hypothetical protein
METDWDNFFERKHRLNEFGAPIFDRMIHGLVDEAIQYILRKKKFP